VILIYKSDLLGGGQLVTNSLRIGRDLLSEKRGQSSPELGDCRAWQY